MLSINCYNFVPFESLGNHSFECWKYPADVSLIQEGLYLKSEVIRHENHSYVRKMVVLGSLNWQLKCIWVVMFRMMHHLTSIANNSAENFPNLLSHDMCKSFNEFLLYKPNMYFSWIPAEVLQSMWKDTSLTWFKRWLWYWTFLCLMSYLKG